MILSRLKHSSWYHFLQLLRKFPINMLSSKNKEIQKTRESMCGTTCLAGEISRIDAFKYQRIDAKVEVFCVIYELLLLYFVYSYFN